jgi:hypothetical protein
VALIDSIVIVGGGILVALLVPLLSGLGALLGTLDGDVVPSFYDAFGGVGHHMERSQKWCSMCVASGHPYWHHLRIVAEPPPSTKLVVE